MSIISCVFGRSARRLGGALLLFALAGCASHSGHRSGPDVAARSESQPVVTPQHFYPPPGPPDDPWGPYIREASARFGVPERWLRAVMHQESGGQEQAVSPVGAMGLMQVMPATYAELKERYGLGDDPYDPHNNVLAGTAYIREMYDRYGAPGFLAAYNAGPARVDDYLAGDAGLPSETVGYLAAITPHLGNDPPLSGPFVSYASLHLGRGAGRSPTVASLASGCDLDAAYDPRRPCTSLEQAAVTPVRAPVQVASAGICDPDAAYDPSQKCRYAPATVAAPASLSRPAPAAPGGGWGIQIGAFHTPELARAVAEGARAQAPEQLASAGLAFPPITSSTGTQLYRARLVHLSANGAAAACQQLNRRQLPCIVVQPGSA